MAGSQRIYSEEEIGRVLKRAAALQGKRPNTPRYGLSLEELLQLAEETGLDPALVEVAATELEGDAEAEKSNLWGGPLSATLIRSVEGTVSDETWEEMLAAMRKHFKETGSTEQRGTTRQWKTERKDGGGHLIATRKGERTELEIFGNQGALAIPIYIIPLIGSIIALPFIFEALDLSGFPALAMWLGISTVLFFFARMLVSRASGNARRELRDTIERLAQMATDASGESERMPSNGGIAQENSGLPSGEASLRLETEDTEPARDQRPRTTRRTR